MLDNVPADTKTEAGTCRLLSQGVADLVKLLEDTLVAAGIDSDAGIADIDVRLVSHNLCRERDVAMVGKFDRIPEEIGQHLADAVGVGPHVNGQLRQCKLEAQA